VVEGEGGGDPDDVHPGWYVFALVLYVALSFASLSLRDNVVLLNWIIGPLFPVFVLYVVPTAVRRVARGRQHA
jgi:hypothetical protein